jgi:hypothetical protein
MLPMIFLIHEHLFLVPEPAFDVDNSPLSLLEKSDDRWDDIRRMRCDLMAMDNGREAPVRKRSGFEV